jgi:hypothetical protein
MTTTCRCTCHCRFIAASLLCLSSRIGRCDGVTSEAMKRIARPAQREAGWAHEADFVICDQTIEDENRRLKQLVADLTLDRQMLQEALRKNW